CLPIRLLFFFQAEDGIRAFHVTGVQTCALPISPPVGAPPDRRTAPVRTEQALPTRADTYSHPPRVLLQTQNATPTCRSTAPVRTACPTRPNAPPHIAPVTGAPTNPKRDAPPVGAPPDRRTARCEPSRHQLPRLPPSHPTRVLLQAARPCRSTAPGANAPLTLSPFLMLLIQQIHNPTGRRIPLHSRQQRLAHKLIIIITHRLAQRIQNGQQRVPVQKHLIGAVNFRMGSGLRVIPD